MKTRFEFEQTEMGWRIWDVEGQAVVLDELPSEEAAQGEHPIAEIAHLFGGGVTFVKKMLSLHRAGDDLEPRHGGGPAPRLREKELALLRKEVKKRPDARLDELQQVLADKAQVTASLPTLCRARPQLDLPRKKKSHRR